jgi:glycosyltransferase involved in cell wall biosynthesis
MTTPDVSVIIPSYQSEETIRSCLDSLLVLEFHPPHEIIVVDSSTDSTPEIIRNEYPGIHLIHLPKKTDPAAARNLGARSALGEVLAFIDSDCTAERNWLQRLYDDLMNGCSAVGGSILNANDDDPVSWAGYFCEFREFLPLGGKREASNLTLGNAAYKKDAFWDVGAFPEGCFPQEDQVFHRLFVKKGYRICYDPANSVRHRHRTNVSDFYLHQMHIGRANAAVVRRLNLPGDSLVRSPFLARLAMPAVAAFRFARTVLACWKVENYLIMRKIKVLWLCARGMAWWGKGFIQGADEIQKAGKSGHVLFNG